MLFAGHLRSSQLAIFAVYNGVGNDDSAPAHSKPRRKLKIGQITFIILNLLKIKKKNYNATRASPRAA
jgi:hypothetical protein